MVTIEELFNLTVKRKGVELTPDQKEKFLIACEKSIKDNDTNFSREEAAKLFLNMILEFPELSL